MDLLYNEKSKATTWAVVLSLILSPLAPLAKATPTAQPPPRSIPTPPLNPNRLNCAPGLDEWKRQLISRHQRLTNTANLAAIRGNLEPIVRGWIADLEPLRRDICAAIPSANGAPALTRPLAATGAQCTAFQEQAHLLNQSSQPSQQLLQNFESRVQRLMERFYTSRTAYQGALQSRPETERNNLMNGIWGGAASGRELNVNRTRSSLLGKDVMGMQDEITRARQYVTYNNQRIDQLNSRRGDCGELPRTGTRTTAVPAGPGSTPTGQQPGGDGPPGGQPWGVAQEIAGQPPGGSTAENGTNGNILGSNTNLWVAGGMVAAGLGVGALIYNQNKKDKNSSAASMLESQAAALAQQSNSSTSTGTSTGTDTSTTTGGGSGAVTEANGYRYTVSTLPGGVIRRDSTINPIEVRFFKPDGSQSDVNGLLVRVLCTQVCSIQGITEKRTVNGSVDFTDLRFSEEETGMQLRIAPEGFNSVVSPGSFNVRN